MTTTVQAAAAPQLPKGARMLRNTVWNISGQVLPILVGILVLPALIRTIGMERFGFLTLAWVLVGYAGAFDLGLSRVLIRLVAHRLAHGDIDAANRFSLVGMTFLGLFGTLLGLAFALSSSWLVRHVVQVSPELLEEATRAIWLLGISLPFVMLTSGYASVISAHQRFVGLNIVRAGMGVAAYLGPLLVAFWVNRLDALIAFMLFLRVVATAAHAYVAARGCGFWFVPVVPDRVTSRQLMELGGWMAVSNVISPLLTYVDRLLLSTLVALRAIPFYAVPYDLVTKLQILPHALVAALFPLASAATSGTAVTTRILGDSLRLLFVMIFPIVFVVIACAQPGLMTWLGPEFATNSTPVLQLLALGVFFNALAQGPATLIQAVGEPRWMALLHLAELPFFIAALWSLTNQFGILGTAMAAVLRNGIDAIIVFWMARKNVCQSELKVGGAFVPALVATGLLLLALWPAVWLESALAVFFGLAMFGLYAWISLIRPHERSVLVAFLRSNR